MHPYEVVKVQTQWIKNNEKRTPSPPKCVIKCAKKSYSKNEDEGNSKMSSFYPTIYLL